MKQIVTIVKPFRAQAVLDALERMPVQSVLVMEGKGFGRQKDQLPRYLGSEYNYVYLPKIEIHILLDDEFVPDVLERISSIARTGRIGDGKVLVFPVIASIDF